MSLCIQLVKSAGNGQFDCAQAARPEISRSQKIPATQTLTANSNTYRTNSRLYTRKVVLNV